MKLRDRLAAASFTAGPAAFLGGWILMLPIDGDLVPGPWWTAAHAVWLVGFLFFGVMTLALRRMAGPVTGGRRVAVEAVAGVALLSVAANVVQLAIDLAAGLASADGAALRAAIEGAKANPIVETAVYTIGAQLFFVALLVFAVLLAVLRRVTPVSAAVAVSGVVVLAGATLGIGRDSALVAVGMALLWLGVLLLGRGPQTGQAAPGFG
ncbi:hypothetical protein [Nonomuraea sp. LPB2021202275-12-8]|uniref:hypothetical protein n=1 Tax=Nonomuraea sp. LPB2021202275-12-8 TaxID=3120159 RepID=UPI00300DACCA